NFDIKDIKIDFIEGISGLVTLLINCYKKFENKLFLEKALYLLPFIIKKFNSKQECLTGLAHGYSGIALAISALYNVTGDKYLYNLCIDILRFENNHYDSELGNWKDLRPNSDGRNNHYWCHGSAGIALSRLHILKNIGPNKLVENDLQIATRAILDDGLKSKLDHSLCHGTFSNLLILKEINKYYADKNINETITRTFKTLIIDIHKNGYKSGINSKNPINNFMLGKYGLAYAILKYENSSISNNILTLTL
ncbi:lanthionine synthetase LanC family protein, partial [Staphylococcus massiliensis]